MPLGGDARVLVQEGAGDTTGTTFSDLFKGVQGTLGERVRQIGGRVREVKDRLREKIVRKVLGSA